MPWLDILNRKYAIETSHSTESIVNTLKDRIDNAKKNSSWFSFESIQYKKMEIDDYRMIIKRSRTTFNPDAGNGFIVVNFSKANKDSKKITVEIKPFQIGIWVMIGVLLLVTTLAMWQYSGWNTFFILTVAWIFLIGSAYLSVVLFRYGSRNYLKEIFTDIGINDYSLIREK